MKPPRAFIVALFVSLSAGCGGQANVNIGPPQSSTPSTSRSSPANQPASQTSPIVDRTGESCDPNYSPCVPIATDVDCEGGNGNGPAYVRGPVQVVGKDIYGLDRDGNGIGCE